jgi:hypothetical protein
MGERRYGAVGIAREDKEGRARIRARNWGCFGARTALFCYLGEGMLPPQWMDAGIVYSRSCCSCGWRDSIAALRSPGRSTTAPSHKSSSHQTVTSLPAACRSVTPTRNNPSHQCPVRPYPRSSHSSTSEPIAVTEFRFPLRYVADVQVRRRPENRLADQPGDSPATRRARLSRDFCRWLPLPASPCWQATSPPLTYVDAAGPAATADHAVWFALRYWTAWQRGSVRRS